MLHHAALPSVPRSVADPLETHLHCVTGTLNLLVAARDASVKRVVYAASSSAYGDQAGEAKVESMSPAPISPSARPKWPGEYYAAPSRKAMGWNGVAGTSTFLARARTHFAYAAVIPKFISAMLRGGRPTIFGDGTQSRDFTYIDNVVQGNLLACAAPAAVGETINLAAGGRVLLNDLVAQLNGILGSDLAPIHAPERPGDILHSQADISKARALLGYEPAVDFSEGLRRSVDWYGRIPFGFRLGLGYNRPMSSGGNWGSGDASLDFKGKNHIYPHLGPRHLSSA